MFLSYQIFLPQKIPNKIKYFTCRKFFWSFSDGSFREVKKQGSLGRLSACTSHDDRERFTQSLTLVLLWLQKCPVPLILTVGLGWGQDSGRKRRETLECLKGKALTKRNLHFRHSPPTPQFHRFSSTYSKA